MENNIWVMLSFFFVIVIILIVAVAAHLKAKDVNSFYIAKREAKWYLIVGSLMASTISGAAFFGMQAYFYNLGASVFWILLGCAWAWFILCFFIGPKLRRFGQYTIPDYLAERFDSPNLRPVFSLMVSVWMIILLGTLYVQGGLLFANMFGWDYTTSIIVIGIIAIIFTVFGGMIAVLNTDFVSMFILFLAVLIAFPIIINAAGGWNEITVTVMEQKPDFFTNTSSVGVIGAVSWLFIWTFGYLGHPGFLTRFYTALNEREIIKAGIGMGVLYLPFWIFVFTTAAAARVIYPQIADPEIIWMQAMYDYAPGFLVGLSMAAIFTAILSSANTWLLAGATSIGRDIYQKMINKDVSDQKLLIYSKLIILLLGALAVPIGVWRPSYIIEMMTIAYLIAGSSGGLVILLSLYYRNMTKEAAWAGIVGGAIVAITWRSAQLLGVLSGTINPIIPTLIISLITIIIVSQLTKPSAKAYSMYDRLLNKNVVNQ